MGYAVFICSEGSDGYVHVGREEAAEGDEEVKD